MNFRKVENITFRMWDIFDDRLRNMDYTSIITGCEGVYRGSIAHKIDTFVPIITLRIHFTDDCGKVALIVEDRKGKDNLTGDLVAKYTVEVRDEDSSDELEETFETMISDVLREYGKYNKKNRLNFSKLGIDYKEINY